MAKQRNTAGSKFTRLPPLERQARRPLRSLRLSSVHAHNQDAAGNRNWGGDPGGDARLHFTRSAALPPCHGYRDRGVTGARPTPRFLLRITRLRLSFPAQFAQTTGEQSAPRR